MDIDRYNLSKKQSGKELREKCRNECYFYDYEKDICDCEIYGHCPIR